jgi:RNase adaptor protein for sRNA GlmZ degradation
MTTVIRVLDPSCAAIQAVLHDKAAVVANGRDVGFIRNAAAHSIGLNVFAVLAAPQHHERLKDLAKSFKVFLDMKDIRVIHVTSQQPAIVGRYQQDRLAHLLRQQEHLRFAAQV